jgi:Glyoxalase/Bleomycin resistance protein/Dioxygenase superfamily
VPATKDDARPLIDEIRIGDAPDPWRAAGFTVDDGGVCVVGTVRLRLVGRDDGPRILGWTVRNIDIGGDDTLDGVPTAIATSPVESPEAATHANGVRIIDHVVVASPNLPRTIDALVAAGLDPRRTRDSDTYGAPMRQVFFRLGEVILECIGAPDPAPPPIGDGPAGFFGLAFTVDDLDATKAFFGDDIGVPKSAVQPGRRIATLRHKQLGLSVPLAFMSTGEQEYE